MILKWTKSLHAKLCVLSQSLKAVLTAISQGYYLNVNFFVNERIVMYFDKN